MVVQFHSFRVFGKTGIFFASFWLVDSTKERQIHSWLEDSEDFKCQLCWLQNPQHPEKGLGKYLLSSNRYHQVKPGNISSVDTRKEAITGILPSFCCKIPLHNRITQNLMSEYSNMQTTSNASVSAGGTVCWWHLSLWNVNWPNKFYKIKWFWSASSYKLVGSD